MPQAKGKSVTYVTMKDFKASQEENRRVQNLILEKLGEFETSKNVMNYQQVVQAQPEPKPKAKTWQEIAIEMGGEIQTIQAVRVDEWDKFREIYKQITGKTNVPTASVNGSTLVVLV